MTTFKNSAGFSAFEALLILFVICVVGLAGWLMHHAHKTSRTAAISETSQQTDKYQTLYAQLKDKVSQQPDVTASFDNWAAQTGSGAILSASGFDYSISSQMFPGLRIGADVDYNSQAGQPQLSTLIQNIVNSVMGQAGYKISSKQYSITGYAPGDKELASNAPHTAYENNGNTCLSTYTSGTATISCFTQGDVIRALEQAKSYVVAYRSATGSRNQSLIFGPITIKSEAKSGVIGPSHATGYDISEAVIADNDIRNIAIYYKKNSGPWIYVTQALDEFGFSCDAYGANPDASKALYGQACLGPSGQIHFGTGTKATQ